MAEKIDTSFQDRKEFVDHLRRLYSHVRQSTVYSHAKKGWLKVNKDGTISPASANKYVEEYVWPSMDGAALKDAKTRAEIRLKEDQGRSANVKADTDEGRVINRDQVNLDYATKWVILVDTLEQSVWREIEKIQSASSDRFKLRDKLYEIINDAFGKIADIGNITARFTDKEAENDVTSKR